MPYRPIMKTLKDAFGYSYYFAFILAPLPGILISGIRYFTKSKKANKIGLNAVLLIMVILSAGVSAQMTYQNSSYLNGYLERVIFYLTS